MQPLLSGVRVLDLSRMLAGPYGSMLLGDLGADVIKIEMPGQGDLTRAGSPVSVQGVNAYFLSINKSKKSITLDLTKPKGRDIFYQLVKRADVVYDNFRPAVLDKLGLSYEAMREANPRIIWCSLSAFGQDGPYRDMPGYDIVIQAMGGVMSITGPEGGEPVALGIPLGDTAGGLFAALAISAALHRRNETGEGARLDISLLDCQISLLVYIAQGYIATGEVPGPRGVAHPMLAPFRVFKTADGYAAVVAFQDKHWRELCRIMDAEHLLEDERFNSMVNRVLNKTELHEILIEIFQKRTTTEWLESLQEAGIPCGPVNPVDKALSDPQVLHRNMVVEMDHPLAGKYDTVGNPVKVADVADGGFGPPPDLGEHTRQILMEELGYSASALDELARDGII